MHRQFKPPRTREASIILFSTDSEEEIVMKEPLRKRQRNPPSPQPGPSRSPRALRSTKRQRERSSDGSEQSVERHPAVRRSERARKIVMPLPSPTRSSSRASTEPSREASPVMFPSKVPPVAVAVAVAKVAPPVCVLCNRDEVDRVRYFRMDSQGDLHAHYLCMFTASNLHQTGDPRAKTNPLEICGFLCENLKKERRRAARLTCKYCKKKGAAVGCAVKRCSASYHYPCGVENGCFFKFTGSFESYCPLHTPKGTIPRPCDMATVKTTCPVCLEDPPLSDKQKTLITPCCQCAVHRECLSSLAVNAGKHYIRCPACNVVDNFKAFCDQVGVHVPNADATWLADEEAERMREDQEEGDEVECAAASSETCMCPNGTTYDEDIPGRDWNIERCSGGCGALMHAGCMKHVGRKGSDRRNLCVGCFELEMKINEQLGRRVTAYREEKEGSPEIPEQAASQTRGRGCGRGGRR